MCVCLFLSNYISICLCVSMYSNYFYISIILPLQMSVMNHESPSSPSLPPPFPLPPLCCRASLKATLVLLPLLGLTWVLGFLAIRHDQSKAVAYIFTYLFTVTNSCQGVFFLVVHCLLNVEVCIRD